jgi:tetratricopeptide (TPR) repeat protein
VTLISFFAAVISHHVEMLSGIGVVATSSLFWVFGALTVVIGLFPLSVDEIAPVEAATKNALRSRSMAKSSKDERVWAKDLRRVGANIGALTLVMLTLGAVFIVVPQAASSVSGTLANSLTSLSGSKGPTSYGMLGLFFGALLLTGLLLQLETDALFGRKPGWSDLLTAVGLGLLVSTVLWLIRASQLVTIKQAQDAGDIAVFSTGIVGLLTGYCGMLLLLFLVWAVALSPEGKRPVRAVRQNLASMTGYVLLLAAGLVLIVSTNLLSMQADIYFSLAKNIIDPSQKQTIQAMYERALEMAPNQYEYFLFAGENFYRFAVSEADPANKENWTKLAFEKLQRAYQLNPFVVDNMIALARTYRLWGESTQDSAFKASRFSQAEAYYQQAMKIKGGRIDYLLDWADFSISKGEFAAAQKQIGVALAVDGSYDVSYALLGKSYLAQAGTEQDAALRAELLNKAVLAFQKQAELLTQQGGNPAFALINLGNAYQSLQEYEEARATYLRAVEAGAGEYQWKVFVEMAKLSGKLNDLAGLRGYLQKAVESAPAAEKPALQSKLDSLAP